MRRHPIGNLPLHHQNCPLHNRLELKQPQQNVRRDVVRQIPNHQQLFSVHAPQRRKIRPQNIPLQNLDRNPIRKLLPQPPRQLPIQLNRHQPTSPPRQQRGKSAPPRPNLHHGPVRSVPQRVDDGSLRRGIDKEVLTEPGSFATLRHQ